MHIYVRVSDIEKNALGNYEYRNSEYHIDQYGTIYEVLLKENRAIGKLNGRTARKALADILNAEYNAM